MSLSAAPTPPLVLSPLWAELLRPRPEVFGSVPTEHLNSPEQEAEDGEPEEDAA